MGISAESLPPPGPSVWPSQSASCRGNPFCRVSRSIRRSHLHPTPSTLQTVGAGTKVVTLHLPHSDTIRFAESPAARVFRVNHAASPRRPWRTRFALWPATVAPLALRSPRRFGSGCEAPSSGRRVSSPTCMVRVPPPRFPIMKTIRLGATNPVAVCLQNQENALAQGQPYQFGDVCHLPAFRPHLVHGKSLLPRIHAKSDSQRTLASLPGALKRMPESLPSATLGFQAPQRNLQTVSAVESF